VILQAVVVVVLVGLAPAAALVDLVLLFLKFLLLMVIVDSSGAVEQVEITVTDLVELVVVETFLGAREVLELLTPEEVVQEVLMAELQALVDPVYASYIIRTK
jgi:hypothetical protein